MNSCKVLSAIWGKKNNYNYIEEDLILESTFIQQTRNGENLWKAQLGMTQNYLIFLRKENEFMLNHASHFNINTEKLNLLLNMIPISHLTIKRPRKRTLEILFTSGNICYFKLLIGPGCGKAWAQWRNLAHISSQDIMPLPTESKLIPFPQLDIDVQRNLWNQKFLICFTTMTKHVAQIAEPMPQESSDVSDEKILLTTDDSGLETDINLTTTHSCINEKGTEENNLQDTNETAKERDYQSKRSRAAVGERKKTRKTKIVRRFGEGIPENCAFELSLSYSDETDVDPNSSKNSRADVPNEFHNSPKQPTLPFLRKSKSDSDVSQRKITKEQNGSISKEWSYIKNHMKVRNILNATKSFINVSFLITPGGLRRSKSVDSVSKIFDGGDSKNYQFYNLSLPDVREIPLYRRNDRLSFAIDHFENIPSLRLKEGHSSHGISFWMPSDNNSSGRIYCTAPICKKIFAYRKRLYLIRTKHLRHLYPKDGITDLLGNRLNNAGQNLAVRTNKKNNPSCISLREERTGLNERINGNAMLQFQSRRSSRLRSAVPDGSMNKAVADLDPYVMAFELHRIQQRMFCQIETPEIVRYILRPHTVSEVNCPYLCGYLYFSERLKNIVIAELRAQKRFEEVVRTHRLFSQIAAACFSKGDEQSGYAILGGLCSPIIPHYSEHWRHILKDHEDVEYLSQLFEYCRSRRKWLTSKRHLPLFLDFVTFVVERLIRKSCSPHSLTLKKGSVWSRFIPVSKCHGKNTENRRIFSEMRILGHEQLENVIKITEECRKYYTYQEMSNTHAQNHATTRKNLLFKKYNV